VVGRWGFEIVESDGSAGLWQRFGLFWENLYAWALVWTYNPGSLKNNGGWKLHRRHMWLSRATLLAKYAPETERDPRPEVVLPAAQGSVPASSPGGADR